jgi:hypothetical protein
LHALQKLLMEIHQPVARVNRASGVNAKCEDLLIEAEVFALEIIERADKQSRGKPKPSTRNCRSLGGKYLDRKVRSDDVLRRARSALRNGLWIMDISRSCWMKRVPDASAERIFRGIRDARGIR